MDHQDMQDTKSYLERGRRFEGLSVEDLNKGWVAAFTSVCAHGDHSRATDPMISGRACLRKLDKPDHLVHRDAMKMAQERVRAARTERTGRWRRRSAKFRDEMSKPKN